MAAGSLFGYAIDSEIPLARLGRAAALRGTITVTRARERIDAEPGEVIYDLRDGTNAFTLAVRDGRLLALCSATGGFRLDPEQLAVEADCDEPGEAWEHRLVSAVVPLLLAERGDLVLHAAAVELDGAALLFAGTTGRGKSTLALTLAEAGAPLLAEDGVAISVDGPELLAWPGPTGVRLVHEGERKRTRLLPEHAHVDRPLPLGAVVLLGERGTHTGPPVALEPVSALPALLPNLIFAGDPGLGRAFRLAARLVETTPVLRYAFPDDLVVLPRLAAELRDELARPGGERRFAAPVRGGA